MGERFVGEFGAEYAALGLYALLATIFVVGLLVVVVDPKVDLQTGLSASLACFGNIGPAFGFAGPMGSYAPFNDAAKILLVISMWLGRLEVVTVLALLHPHVWRHLRWRGTRRQGV